MDEIRKIIAKKDLKLLREKRRIFENIILKLARKHYIAKKVKK